MLRNLFGCLCVFRGTCTICIKQKCVSIILFDLLPNSRRTCEELKPLKLTK